MVVLMEVFPEVFVDVAGRMELIETELIQAELV